MLTIYCHSHLYNHCWTIVQFPKRNKLAIFLTTFSISFDSNQNASGFTLHINLLCYGNFDGVFGMPFDFENDDVTESLYSNWFYSDFDEHRRSWSCFLMKITNGISLLICFKSGSYINRSVLYVAQYLLV